MSGASRCRCPIATGVAASQVVDWIGEESGEEDPAVKRASPNAVTKRILFVGTNCHSQYIVVIDHTTPPW